MIRTVCSIRLKSIARATVAVMAAVLAATAQTGQPSELTTVDREASDSLNGEIPKENNIVVQQAKYVSYEESDGKPRSLKKRISLEMGGAVSPYSYCKPDPNSKDDDDKSDYIMGVGVYSRADLIYAELVYELATGQGWFSGMAGVLAKYPVGNDVIKLSPLLGYGVISPSDGLIFGGRLDVGITETAYLRSEYLYCLGRGNVSDAMSFKIGGGLDRDLGEKKRTYVRYELMYMYNWGAFNNDYQKKSTVHHFDIRFGTGYKWGGQMGVKKQ